MKGITLVEMEAAIASVSGTIRASFDDARLTWRNDEFAWVNPEDDGDVREPSVQMGIIAINGVEVSVVLQISEGR